MNLARIANLRTTHDTGTASASAVPSSGAPAHAAAPAAAMTAAGHGDRRPGSTGPRGPMWRRAHRRRGR
jgi:hypothetical protein